MTPVSEMPIINFCPSSSTMTMSCALLSLRGFKKENPLAGKKGVLSAVLKSSIVEYPASEAALGMITPPVPDSAGPYHVPSRSNAPAATHVPILARISKSPSMSKRTKYLFDWWSCPLIVP